MVLDAVVSKTLFLFCEKPRHTRLGPVAAVESLQTRSLFLFQLLLESNCSEINLLNFDLKRMCTESFFPFLTQDLYRIVTRQSCLPASRPHSRKSWLCQFTSSFQRFQDSLRNLYALADTVSLGTRIIRSEHRFKICPQNEEFTEYWENAMFQFSIFTSMGSSSPQTTPLIRLFYNRHASHGIIVSPSTNFPPLGLHIK